MLGFLPLSTEPLSSVIAEIVRLESNALLDSLSIFNPTAFSKFFFDSSLDNNSQIQALNKIILTESTLVDVNGNFYPAEKLNIPGSINLETNNELITSVLSKVHSSKSIEVFSELALETYIKTQLTSRLDAETSYLSAGIVKNYNTISYASNSEINPLEKILISNSSILENESIANFYPSFKTIGNSVYSINTELELTSKIITSLQVQIGAQSDITAILGALYSLNSDIEIIGTISSNLSQRNRDIVYYILAIDKSKPFELKILRAK